MLWADDLCHKMLQADWKIEGHFLGNHLQEGDGAGGHGDELMPPISPENTSAAGHQMARCGDGSVGGTSIKLE